MVYEDVTKRILDLCQRGDALLKVFNNYNQLIKQGDGSNETPLVRDAEKQLNVWASDCIKTFQDSELLIEVENFNNYNPLPKVKNDYHKDLGSYYFYIQNQKALILGFANEIEGRKNKKELHVLTIDDIDSFIDVKRVTSQEVKEYAESVFLEEDVKNAILDALGETYKEFDSGSEIRDLFTDKLMLNGKRLSAAMMLKGRSVKGPLTLRDCGKNGNQLLKLSQNTSAQCLVVQHVNKIEQDVRATLIDHVLMNSRFPKVYICFIDGVDTARFLKSRGLNLDELKAK